MENNRIIDFISGVSVQATPEEVHAVQVFSKKLVRDFHYPKSHIQTRPQFRVKVRPSDTRKSYPIDIAVFNDEKKRDEDISIIVECKKPDRKDGTAQLKDYLRFSDARLGVWFNGKDSI